MIEVNKDLKNFFEHGHKAQGPVGWDTSSGIDLVFAATGTNSRKENLAIPFIIAFDFDDSKLDKPYIGKPIQNLIRRPT
ncbi:hypothetical protein [Haladaptatus sp. NG-WS-4]